MEKCIKCNSNEIGVEYFKVGKFILWGDSRYPENRSRFMRDDNYYTKDKVKEEHLVYTCKSCGYETATVTKDRKND